MIGKRSRLLLTWLLFGYAFLYIPILSLVVYSFNESKLVTVWGGFSTKWYGELFRNDQMIEAILLSLRVAIVSSTVAVALGTLAGMALARFRRFRGRVIFGGSILAPMVMPEVILGLSLLLLFVSLEQMIGWPARRGETTITIAHATIGMAYVAVIVQARLSDMGTDLEEAAMDLGARPFKVFWVITLPLILPALVAGWLLSFTLSLDDLVIASFVTGPGSTTLPMVIFSKVRLGLNPMINAVATLIIATVAIGIIIAGITMYRQARRERASS